METWRSSFSQDKKSLQMPIWVIAYIHESNILQEKQIKWAAFKDHTAPVFNAVHRQNSTQPPADVRSWRWRLHVPLKRRLHTDGTIAQKTVTIISAAVKILNSIYISSGHKLILPKTCWFLTRFQSCDYEKYKFSTTQIATSQNCANWFIIYHAESCFHLPWTNRVEICSNFIAMFQLLFLVYWVDFPL